MGVLEIIAIVAGICSIVGFVLQLVLSKIPKTQKWIWVAIVVIMTLSTGYTVYSESELKRINDIHRHAEAIINHHVPTGFNKAFMQEVLTFLEENRERYPDSYERAKQIYDDMKRSTIQYDYEPAMEMEGIMKGIATLNE